MEILSPQSGHTHKPWPAYGYSLPMPGLDTPDQLTSGIQAWPLHFPPSGEPSPKLEAFNYRLEHLAYEAQPSQFFNVSDARMLPQDPGKPVRRTIPQSQWDHFRPEITDMYQRRGLPLLQVCQHMKENHGFDADQQMYKKRLAKWGVFKNYSRKTKQDILRAHGNGEDLKTINGRPIRHDRLRRPVKVRGTMVRLQPDGHRPNILPPNRDVRPQKPTQQQLVKTQFHMSPITSTTSSPFFQFPAGPNLPIPRLHLDCSPESRILENSLALASGYYDWYFSQRSLRWHCPSSGELARFCNALVDGASLLSKNTNLGFSVLRKACSLADSVIAAHQYLLLTDIVSNLVNRACWNNFLDVRSEILSYCVKFARHRHGTKHAIPQILESCENLEVGTQLARHLVKISSNAVERHKHLIGADELIQYRLTAIDELFHEDHQLIAQNVLDELSQHVGRLYPEDRLLALRIAYRRGLIANARGFSVDAEQLWISVVDQGTQIGAWRQVSNAAHRVACLYLKDDRLSDSETYYRMALSSAIKAWGVEDSAVAEFYVSLQKVLFEQDKSCDQLEAEYPEVVRQLRTSDEKALHDMISMPVSGSNAV